MFKVSVVIIGVALVLISYSLFMIIGSNRRAANMLDEWEMLVEQHNNRTPEPSPADTSPPENTPPDTSSDEPSESSSAEDDYIAGLLVFPTIRDRRVVVVRGTTDEDIRGAAGMATYLTEPGTPGNTLVFGHRDGVFSGFSNLELGDSIFFKTLDTEHEYIIDSFTVTRPYDELITRNYDEDVLTLVTCYPFNFIGNAPWRYIVVAYAANPNG